MTSLSDSRFALLTSESLLKNHTSSLNRFAIPDLQTALLSKRWGLPKRGFYRLYQLVRVRERILYVYPHGSSFLSLPFVALMDLIGTSTVTPGGTYNPVAEALQEKLLASFLMAITASLFFEIGIQTGLSVLWSTALTAAGTLGSPIWSSASRTLWSQTWEVFLGTWVVLLLFSANRGRLHSYWISTILAWMFFVRPSGAIAIVCVTLYLWFVCDGALGRYIGILVVWLLLFLVYWLAVFGQALPDYYRWSTFLEFTRVVIGLPGVLISPSRGLLVFMPTIPLLIYLLARYWNSLDREFALLAITIIGGNVFVAGCDPIWWGGSCYGPRLLTETMPWFVVLGAFACRSLAGDAFGHKGLVWFGCLLVVPSAGINGWGAVSQSTELWNRAVAISDHPSVLWDWRHPQFLAGL